MRTMQLKEQNDLQWFETIDINNNLKVIVAFTCRSGGYSQHPYTSLNMATHVNDDYKDVIANRKRFLQMYQMDVAQSVAANQVHGNQVYHVTKKDLGKGSIYPPISDADGLITHENDIALLSFYADCVPIYIWDSHKGIISVAHAGWKGTTLDIGGKMVENFCKNFNSNVGDIQTVIGPSICKTCYQVGPDVVEQFKISFDEKELKQFAIEQAKDQYQLDLWKANEQLLLRRGILPHNLTIMGLCTSCNPNLFFSHRRDHGKTGRMAAVIMQTKVR